MCTCTHTHTLSHTHTQSHTHILDHTHTHAFTHSQYTLDHHAACCSTRPLTPATSPSTRPSWPARQCAWNLSRACKDSLPGFSLVTASPPSPSTTWTSVSVGGAERGGGGAITRVCVGGAERGGWGYHTSVSVGGAERGGGGLSHACSDRLSE